MIVVVYYLRLLFNFLKAICLFIGSLTNTFSKVLQNLFDLKLNLPEFTKESVYFIYSLIIPVGIIAISLGVVTGVQLGPEFVSNGIGNKLGILAALTMTRELIPVVGSLMITTQYGTGLAAQIANMKITEQIDALTVFSIDPIYYLVTPRFLVAVIFAPILIWFASILSILSNFITVWFMENISFKAFISSIWAYYKITDINLCLLKASIFGGLIVIIASTLGLNTTGGAKEVGKTTTNTVIYSFIAIILLDYVITSLYL